MITADKIRRLAYLDTTALEAAVNKNYPEDSFVSSKFLGISNGGQFCYSVKYFDEEMGIEQTTKVFVDLDNKEEAVAEY
jgi:hypothetical protein